MTDSSTTHDTIPEFTETELWTIRNILKERYGKDIPIELADAELRPDPDDRILTPCPTVLWSERGANFALFRVGDNLFRCQFFYRAGEQYGAGCDVYDDLGQSVITTRQVQSDHERDKKLSDAERPKTAEGEWYKEPDFDDSTDIFHISGGIN
jgi:hypothetical protein